MAHESLEPSAWVTRWAALVTRGRVLDIASGSGRHARLFAARGLEVTAVDRDPQAIPGVRFVKADLEDGSPWPFAGQRFGAIVVTNYLHRPLFPLIPAALRRDLIRSPASLVQSATTILSLGKRFFSRRVR